jgi:hypothetical protein
VDTENYNDQVCEMIDTIASTNSEWKFILEEEGCETVYNKAIDTWEQIKFHFGDADAPLNVKIVKYFEYNTLKIKDIF